MTQQVAVCGWKLGNVIGCTERFCVFISICIFVTR